MQGCSGSRNTTGWLMENGLDVIIVDDDAFLITGNASDDVVDMCVASDVNHLLEKPIRPYALQLAVRSIAMKYIRFAKRLTQDPDFASSVARFQ